MITDQRWIVALAIAALWIAGCGGGDEGSATSASTAAAPTTTATADPGSSGTAEDSADDAAEAGTTEVDATAETDEGDAAPGETADVPDSSVLTTVATPDGLQLAATLYGEGTNGIVLAHMRGQDQSTWDEFARLAAAEGYKVLTFDFRGYGGSAGTRDTNLDVDLLAAVAFIEQQGATQVVVMGASMGGTATINVASQLDLVGAASLSAPGEFLGLPATTVAADVAEPLLLVAAEDDQPYASDAMAMHDLAGASQLEVFPGSAHGTNLFESHGDELTALLLDFAATSHDTG